MPTNAASTQGHAVPLYFLGLGFIMLGACLMDYFDSLVPMAACASAGLMLSAPLIKQRVQRFMGRTLDRSAE
ncbi:MAG: hypothetical protein Q7V20_10020 [Aquabacterium sp.]|uniref:hypothetical protein n=1 Tax=Aquabacterium sp. TaxID=1872578 RepID=UPI002722FEE0|nr:hypothetical protein [Aquabacterium sp.]MDO9003776.1 hypothetical protein [Aquabacterium sp.]